MADTPPTEPQTEPPAPPPERQRHWFWYTALRFLAVPGALLILFINVVGHLISWLAHRLDYLRFVQLAEQWVKSLTPYQSLYLLISILFLLAPLEVGMIWALASYRFEVFLMLEVASKILTPILLVRTWLAAEHKLLEIPWCKYWYLRGVGLYNVSKALLQEMRWYREAIAFIKAVQETAQDFWQQMVRVSAPIRVKIQVWTLGKVQSTTSRQWPKEITLLTVTPLQAGWRHSRVALYSAICTLCLGLIVAIGIAFFADEVFNIRFHNLQALAVSEGFDLNYEQDHACSWIVPCRVYTHAVFHHVNGATAFDASAGRVKVRWYWWSNSAIIRADGPVSFSFGQSTAPATVAVWEADALLAKVNMSGGHVIGKRDDVWGHLSTKISGVHALGTTNRIAAAVAFAFTGPRFNLLSPKEWENWRLAGGNILIDRLGVLEDQPPEQPVRQDAATLLISGTMALDAKERPEGLFTLGVKNLEILVPSIDPMLGQFDEKVAKTLRFALHILAAARTEDDRSDLNLPFSIEDGDAYIGPIKLFSISPLFVPPAH